jgi:hypothetical protein
MKCKNGAPVRKKRANFTHPGKFMVAMAGGEPVDWNFVFQGPFVKA